MLNGVFQELDRYGSMIEFLASGSKDLKEVVAYLKDMGVPESTVRGQINNIKEGTCWRSCCRCFRLCRSVGYRRFVCYPQRWR